MLSLSCAMWFKLLDSWPMVEQRDLWTWHPGLRISYPMNTRLSHLFFYFPLGLWNLAMSAIETQNCIKTVLFDFKVERNTRVFFCLEFICRVDYDFFTIHSWTYLDVSENSGTPKSINHPFWGTPIFGNTHVVPNRFYDSCWAKPARSRASVTTTELSGRSFKILALPRVWEVVSWENSGHGSETNTILAVWQATVGKRRRQVQETLQGVKTEYTGTVLLHHDTLPTFDPEVMTVLNHRPGVHAACVRFRRFA